jgi:hypothetical protein
MNVSALGASGLRGVQLPPLPGDPITTPGATPNSVTAVHFAVDSSGKRHGAVSLAGIALAKGTRVWIQRTHVPRHYRISLQGDALALHADIRGAVRIVLDGNPSKERNFASPQPVFMQGDSGLVDLDLTMADASHAGFVPQLQASDLSLSSVQEFQSESRTLVRRLSTILSGTLYFEALNGLAYQLRPGEALQFERAEGLIRTLQLKEDHIALKFRGHVRGMRTGWDNVQRSLMPTYLEWLRARHGLYLLWGTTLYLFGIIASLLHWWEVRV